jgi:presenilin-like A22 family membrane protease
VFAVVTAVMLVMLRKMQSPGAVVILMRVSLVLGVSLLAWRLGGEPMAVAAVPTVVLGSFLYRRVWAVDLAVLAASAGIAIEVGVAMVAPSAVTVLAFLAVYDLVAVFGTKHMTFMAERLMSGRAIFALAVPFDRSVWLSDFAAPATTRRYALLGIGDLVIPTILFVSAYRLTPSAAYATGAGIVAGVAALSIWLKKRNYTPLPALPPLAGGAVVGFMLWWAAIWITG